MATHAAFDTAPTEQAYPLMRRFTRHMLPWFLGVMAVLVAAMAWGGREIVLQVYQEQTARSAAAVMSALLRQQPVAARAWLATFNRPQGLPLDAALLSAVGDALDGEVRDRALPKMKIYDVQGVIRYSTVRNEIGRIERTPGLDEVLRRHAPVVARVARPGGDQFELYGFRPASAQAPELIVELYEPATFLDQVLWRTLAPAVLVPLALLMLLLGVLFRMIAAAQRQMVAQQAQVAALQTRLERLVSARAVRAARADAAAPQGGYLMDASLYFSDVRDFTSFAESTRPHQVVTFLNHIFSIQVEQIAHYGGDVDKFIGDAVLAVFTGQDRAERALACAQAVLRQCAALANALPRGVAVAVHDGVVVAGAIGAQDRQDDTVIGDAVNVAQRLCTLARRGELVSDSRTVQRAGLPEGFGAAEEVVVKGRSEPLRVRRWPTAAVPTAQPEAPGGADHEKGPNFG